jgi:hypothetical protein
MEQRQCGVQRNNRRNLISKRIVTSYFTLINRVPSYNADGDVPMTEADLSPLLSKPSSEREKDKKEKKDKDKKQKHGEKEKKRSRKEMEDEDDEVEEKVISQTKSNGLAAPKTEKSKSKKDHVGSKSYSHAN